MLCFHSSVVQVVAAHWDTWTEQDINNAVRKTYVFYYESVTVSGIVNGSCSLRLFWLNI